MRDQIPVIKLVDVHKIYRTGEVEVHAVRGVSLEVCQGEFVAIMGASGSGKSTLMNIIGCLDRPTWGQYFLDGVDVSTLGPDERAEIRNRKVGFVFQNFNLLPRTTALENVELPMFYAKNHFSKAEMRQRAINMLQLVGLGEKINAVPSQLSGGQQQRVAIARALVMNPSLVLADEPTGNLDSLSSVELMGVFQDLNEKGITIVMVTHEPDVAKYARRMVVLRDGRILKDVPVTERLIAREELKKLRSEHPAIQVE
jgi:putative ABC transport system ATP-binding protein